MPGTASATISCSPTSSSPDLAVTAEQPQAAARAAGRGWGRRLAAEHPGANLRQTVEVLAEMGFEPEASPPRRPTEVLLHNCPFRELVDTHQQLVCALHGGMIEALLATPDGEATLVPQVSPTSCVVHLPAS